MISGNDPLTKGSLTISVNALIISIIRLIILIGILSYPEALLVAKFLQFFLSVHDQ